VRRGVTVKRYLLGPVPKFFSQPTSQDENNFWGTFFFSLPHARLPSAPLLCASLCRSPATPKRSARTLIGSNVGAMSALVRFGPSLSPDF
jgi:hypothetical protein